VNRSITRTLRRYSLSSFARVARWTVTAPAGRTNVFRPSIVGMSSSATQSAVTSSGSAGATAVTSRARAASRTATSRAPS
jgi:hypothetical protein